MRNANISNTLIKANNAERGIGAILASMRPSNSISFSAAKASNAPRPSAANLLKTSTPARKN